MGVKFDEYTDTKITYVPPESRYTVLKKWELSAEIEGARMGLLILFLTPDSLVYSEIDDDLIYGGGYPKRERVQKISNYLEFGSMHLFPEWLLKELTPLISNK